jgi:hypothetical protein
MVWGFITALCLWAVGATLCWCAFVASMQFQPVSKPQLYGVLGLGVAFICAGFVTLWRVAVMHGSKNLI